MSKTSTKTTAKRIPDRRVGAPEKFTVEEMAEALRETKGFVSAAARRLACDSGTVYDYMTRYPELKEIRQEAREAEKDLAEMMLGKMIRDGQFLATCFYLKTQAKDRGYVERQEHEVVIDYAKLSDDELQAIASGKSPIEVLSRRTG